MYYKLNNKTLQYEKIKPKSILTVLGIFFLFSALMSYTSVRVVQSERIPILITDSDSTFSKQSVRDYIKQLNIRFPEIVYRQALLESGGFTSNLFRKNNNIFGMRVAASRPTTHKGENLNFAYYARWEDSVIDYALWQAAYAREINSEAAYYKFLDEVYCDHVTGGGTYSSALKNLKI